MTTLLSKNSPKIDSFGLSIAQKKEWHEFFQREGLCGDQTDADADADESVQDEDALNLLSFAQPGKDKKTPKWCLGDFSTYSERQRKNVHLQDIEPAENFPPPTVHRSPIVATKNPRNKNYRYKCGDFLIAGEENAPLVGLITDIVGAKEVEVLVYTGSGKRWKRTSDFKVIHTENVVVADLSFNQNGTVPVEIAKKIHEIFGPNSML